LITAQEVAGLNPAEVTTNANPVNNYRVFFFLEGVSLANLRFTATRTKLPL
jgi:hypothetical protein